MRSSWIVEVLAVFTLTPSGDSGQALVLSRQRRTYGPLRDLSVTPSWGREAPPIPLLRPFDSAQGERNTPPPGMGMPYFVSRFRGGDDGYARVTPRRICDTLREMGKRNMRRQVLDPSRSLGMTWELRGEMEVLG